MSLKEKLVNGFYSLLDKRYEKLSVIEEDLRMQEEEIAYHLYSLAKMDAKEDELLKNNRCLDSEIEIEKQHEKMELQFKIEALISKFTLDVKSYALKKNILNWKFVYKHTTKLSLLKVYYRASEHLIENDVNYDISIFKSEIESLFPDALTYH
jgi:hypothetical protein